MSPMGRRSAVLYALLLVGCGDEDLDVPPTDGGGPPPCDADLPDALPDTAFARIDDAIGDPLLDRLCDEGATPPAELDNPWDLHCRIASGRGASVDERAAPAEALRIVSWNVRFGTDLAGVQQLLDDDAVLSAADVILLSEVDRGCARSGGVDVAREIAEPRGMDWVFGVEFVEHAQGGCEEGNAILSRLPLGNASHRFHDAGALEKDGLHAPYDWSLDADEPRTGRRSFVCADIRVGGGPMHLCSAHLENRSEPDERGAEVQEIIDAIGALPRRRACVAGDFNVFPDIGDTVIDAPLFDAMAAACFVNPHADMPQEERRTRPNLSYQIDFAFLRGVDSVDRGVINGLPEDELPSDHYPVWVDARER